MDKVDVARRHLGTALDLYLRKADPVSVHTLAMAGAEVAEWLAESSGGEPFKNHIMDCFPDLKIRDIREIQRRFSNAFKHASNRDGKARENEVILSAFDGSVNDHVLMVGWYDFGVAKIPRPIEAQVFEAWYLAKFPEKVSQRADLRWVHKYFPGLASLSWERQHSKLIDAIRKAKKMGKVVNDPETDRRSLTLP